jgi:hypothetical protein
MAAQISSPSGLAYDTAGNLYIADTGNFRVRKVTPQGIITTVAGNGVSGTAPDGVQATSGSLAFPRLVAVDKGGTLYIVDGQIAIPGPGGAPSKGQTAVRAVAPNGTLSTVFYALNNLQPVYAMAINPAGDVVIEWGQPTLNGPSTAPISPRLPHSRE